MDRTLRLVSVLLVGLTAGVAGQTPPPPVAVTYHEVVSHRLNRALPIRAPASQDPRDIFGRAVVITVVVAESGTVLSVHPEAGSAEFYAQAVSEALHWRFRPFERDGMPVRVRFRDQINILPPEIPIDVHAAFPAIADPSAVIITMVHKRGAMAASDRSYQVEIHGDGTVICTGCLIAGTHSSRISSEAAAALIQQFRDAHFFGLRGTYNLGVTDISSTTITFQAGNAAQSVLDRGGAAVGMPAAVYELEDAIDRAAAPWTQGNADTVAYLKAEGWDFHGEGAPSLFYELADDPDAVRAMLAAGANPDWALIPAANDANFTTFDMLLQAGAGRGNREVLSLALSGAAGAGDIGIVQRLLVAGAPVNVISGSGQTPLATAASSGALQVVQALLEAGANPDLRDAKGQTALDWALTQHRADVVQVLQDHHS